MDKQMFYRDLETVLEKHGVADHFLIAIALDGEVRTSVRFGGERGPTESNYARRKVLLGEVEDQKLIMYVSNPAIVKAPTNMAGCEHGTPKGVFCLKCTPPGHIVKACYHGVVQDKFCDECGGVV